MGGDQPVQLAFIRPTRQYRRGLTVAGLEHQFDRVQAIAPLRLARAVTLNTLIQQNRGDLPGERNLGGIGKGCQGKKKQRAKHGA